MKHLIEDLLDYSKVGASNFSTTELDLNKIVADVLEDLQVSINEKKATVCFAELPSITGNEYQLYTLFQISLITSLQIDYYIYYFLRF